MVRKVIWSKTAHFNKEDILEYWKTRNNSDEYSKKLNRVFSNSIKLISQFPFMGRPSNKQNVRVVVVRDYHIIYEVFESQIDVLAIFDTRQNPEGSKRFFK